MRRGWRPVPRLHAANADGRPDRPRFGADEQLRSVSTNLTDCLRLPFWAGYGAMTAKRAQRTGES